LALPGERVADVAELAERAPAHPGLLGDLAQGRLLAALARVDLALREGPEPMRPPGGPDRGDHPVPAQPPDEDAAGREFTPHSDETLVLPTEILALCCCRWHSPTSSAEDSEICHQWRVRV